MLDNLNESQKLTLICGIIFFIVILLVISLGFDSKIQSKKDNFVDKNIINNMFDDIKDNYTMTISENINNNFTEYIYYTDGKLELYESNLSEYGYIKYNNNIFYLNNNTMKLNKTNQNISFINNKYYNFNFIRYMMKLCEYEFDSSDSVSCNLSSNDFFASYNNYYNTSYNYDNGNVIIKVKYSDRIKSLSIDYTDVNMIINNSPDIVKYNIIFSNFNNDFSEIYDYYKDILES